MLALADPPDTQPDLIPGLTYSPEWHREQEADERAWLDDYAHFRNRLLRLRLVPGRV